MSLRVYKKENEIVSNEDSGHHLVIDFSSDLDSESPSENQVPVESVPQQVLKMSNTDKVYK